MLAAILKKMRVEAGFKLREISAFTGIDQALLSKFESGDRLPTLKQLAELAQALNLDTETIKVEWLAHKVVELVKYEPKAIEVLSLAESRVEYLISKKTFELPEIPGELKRKLEEADLLKMKWQQFKPLNQTQLRKMEEFFRIENTFESNRIEGNTLTLQETSLVVNEGLTIGGKSMREHLEAVNHAEAIDYLKELIGQNDVINCRNLLELHRLILKGIDKENAGRYRSVPVRITGSRHEPPQPYLLDKLMDDFIVHFEMQRRRLHPVLLAAEVHERLVSIHPFIDGNGRTARLMMNMVLLQHGYTLTQIKGDTTSRLAYYNALQQVQVDNHPVAFYELVTDAAISSLKEHLKMV